MALLYLHLQKRANYDKPKINAANDRPETATKSKTLDDKLIRNPKAPKTVNFNDMPFLVCFHTPKIAMERLYTKS